MTAPLAAQNVVKERLQGTELEATLMCLLRREAEARPEGVAFDLLCEHAGLASRSEVRDCLEKLVADGEVYTTTDNDHFAALC